MGCGSGQKQVMGPTRISTVTGNLKITILNAHIKHDASVFQMDPYINLKLSNQQKSTKVISKGGKEPVFNETFTFFINSCYKIHGRNLQMLLMDKKKVGSDNEIGFGIVDLDPVVQFKKPRDEFRCFVNYDRQDAGYINLIAEFKQQSAKTLSFRFQTASIRRKTRTFGDMNCLVRVIVGEQILETSKQKDTKEAPPVWKDDVLTFNVGQSIKEVQFIFLDEEDVIGNFEMKIDEFLNKTEEQKFNEEFEYNDEVNAGSVKFQSLVGTNPIFSEIKTVHRKKKKEDEAAKAEEKKEDGKGQQKKEEEKKVQEKKEEKKEEEKKQQKKEEVSKSKIQNSEIKNEVKKEDLKVEEIKND